MAILGTCSEFINTLSECRKILLNITLTLLLPLSLIFLLLVGISTRLSGRTTHRIFIILSPDFPEGLIDAVYVTFLLILMFPSTSALLYTIGCAYSSKQTTYKKAVSAIPKVWMRLMLTFLSYIFVLVLYTILAIFLLFIVSYLARTQMSNDMDTAFLVLTIFFTLWFLGLFYISIVWQLASVISILEDGYGFKAMAKSMALTVQGKIGILVVLIHVVLNLLLFGTVVLFQRHVVVDRSRGLVGKAAFGVLLLVLLCALFLFGILVQTLVYFVFKSCNHEDLDKSTLSGHLDSLFGDYVALKVEEGIHMEQV